MWNIEELTGYHPVTTFWEDFSIADRFGAKAVEDTFHRAFAEWNTDYIYLTELVLVLNWKLWQWYEDGNEELTTLYDKLWQKADAHAMETLKGDEASYFFRVTD